ncbi:MAG TPA: outer membrane protein transport protein, partial [Pseudomonadales bacterium]|nr:outer membrane protein transport protein [Pseudomonadales bacterium]
MRITLTLTTALIASQPAFATLFEDIPVGNAYATSMGNAVTASPPGVYSIHFNPAGLAKIKQKTTAIGGSLINLKADAYFYDHDPRFQAFIEEHGMVDEAENTHSKNNNYAFYGPGMKLQKLDIPAMPLPTAGWAWPIKDTSVTFATAIYVPTGAGYSRDDDDSGRFMGRRVAIARINYLSPTIGVQLNDRWSVGGGIAVAWQGLGIDMDFRAPNIGLALVDSIQTQSCPTTGNPSPVAFSPFATLIGLCGSELGPFTHVANVKLEVNDTHSINANIGVLYEPSDWFSWGAVYRAQANNNMSGPFTLTYTDAWFNFFKGLNPTIVSALARLGVAMPGPHRSETGTASVSLPQPATFSTGIKLKVVPRLQFNFDLKWADYEKWETFTVDFHQNLDFLKLASLAESKHATKTKLIIPRYYKSVWNWGMGFEYEYSNQLKLRAGYEDRNSSVPRDRQDLFLPVGNGTLISLGFGYKLDDSQNLDFAIAQSKLVARVPAGSSYNSNYMGADNFVYNPYAGLNYKTVTTINLLEMGYQKTF